MLVYFLRNFGLLIIILQPASIFLPSLIDRATPLLVLKFELVKPKLIQEDKKIAATHYDLNPFIVPVLEAACCLNQFFPLINEYIL